MFEFIDLGKAAIEYIESLRTPEGNQRHRRYGMLDDAAEKSESPLESTFWHYMRKTDIDAWTEVEGQKVCGRYRLDCYIVGNGRRVGVELDGKQYHQDERADRKRDQSLILDGYVDEMIRIPYAAMEYASHATFKVLASWNATFAIRSPGSVYSAYEAKDALRYLTKELNGESVDEQLWHLDNSSEVYDVLSYSLAYARTFDNWRKMHNCKPITRLTKEMRRLYETGEPTAVI
jgi:very-short-patch-repair endonuclease